MYLQWPAYEDMGVVCHCMRPPAFWLVACLHPPPRAQGVTGPPYKGPGSIPPKRCLMITHLFTGLVPCPLVHFLRRPQRAVCFGGVTIGAVRPPTTNQLRDTGIDFCDRSFTAVRSTHVWQWQQSPVALSVAHPAPFLGPSSKRSL